MSLAEYALLGACVAPWRVFLTAPTPAAATAIATAPPLPPSIPVHAPRCPPEPPPPSPKRSAGPSDRWEPPPPLPLPERTKRSPAAAFAPPPLAFPPPMEVWLLLDPGPPAVLFFTALNLERTSSALPTVVVKRCMTDSSVSAVRWRLLVPTRRPMLPAAAASSVIARPQSVVVGYGRAS